VISVENRKIFPPRVFYAPGEGVSLGIGCRRSESKKLESLGYRAEKEVWLYLQPSRYNTSTWQTDGQTDRHRRQ